MTYEARGLIYLDHNATTPIADEVRAAMEPYLRTQFGNPSSDHALGRAARRAVEEAREAIASSIGAEPDEIIFTSGGTESNNLAIRGIAATAPAPRRRIITSTVEHPATTAPLALLAAEGWELARVPVLGSGILDLGAALDALGQDAALVTLLLAQNETGAIMPVQALTGPAHTRGVPVHVDAAQAIGKIPVSVDALGVDVLSIAGHKCYGPKGVGALYVRRGTPLAPLLRGAGQEHGLRPGTEHVAGIVGLGAAVRLAASRVQDESVRIAQLRDELWTGLAARVHGIRRHTPPEACLANTLLVSFPGVRGAELLARVPEIAASTGSACHAGEDHPNATLVAMGVPTEIALGAVRLSLGRGTTHAEIAAATDLLASTHAALLAEACSTDEPGGSHLR